MSTASGEYEVTKLMPRDGEYPKYLVKGRHEVHGRVVGEHQLTITKVPAPPQLKVRCRKARWNNG
jgi:hypothetical protein